MSSLITNTSNNSDRIAPVAETRHDLKWGRHLDEYEQDASILATVEMIGKG